MATYYTTPAANGQGIKLLRYDNEVFFDVEGFDPARVLRYVANFSYKTDDILLCAFPKCGSNWLGNMVWKLKTLTDYKRPKFSVLELEEDHCYVNQEAPRIIQTHYKPSRLPREHLKNNGKIVLMLRNPKDACVSFYHHMKDSKHIQNCQTFDEFFESYFSGDMRSYIDFLKEWEGVLYDKSKHGSSMNVEVFYYEDFKLHPKENLVRLNKFLGFERDDKYLQNVLKQTQFESMKQYAMDNKDSVGKYCVRGDGSSLIFRKGMVGDWKNFMTDAQNKRVDTLLKHELKRGIIEFRYNI